MTNALDRWLTRTLYLSVGYNTLGALALALPGVSYPLFGIPAPNHPVYQAVTILSVALFGLGYFWQARAAVRDRTFLTLAVFGKAGFFVIFLASWIGGAVHGTAPLLAIGDLLLAVLFAVWLWKSSPI